MPLLSIPFQIVSRLNTHLSALSQCNTEIRKRRTTQVVGWPEVIVPDIGNLGSIMSRVMNMSRGSLWSTSYNKLGCYSRVSVCFGCLARINYGTYKPSIYGGAVHRVLLAWLRHIPPGIKEAYVLIEWELQVKMHEHHLMRPKYGVHSDIANQTALFVSIFLNLQCQFPPK